MGSKVVVTYKRKRLFSRSDHSPINLHSDKLSEISESKASANFDNHEESIAEHALQIKDTEFGTCHECPKDKDGENMLQSENCDSQYCGQFSEKQANKKQRLCSACTKQQDSPVSNQTQKYNLDQKTWSKESHVPLEGSPGERCQFDSAIPSNAEEKPTATQSNSLFVNSGSEYEDKCKETSSNSPTPGASCGIESDVMCLKTSDGINCSRQMKEASISGTFASEERNKLNEDQYSGLCNNSLVTKRKLTSTLITFCRRSKRNKDNASNDIASERTDTCASETPLDASCSVELKNEKKPTEDTDNSCSFSAPASAMVMHVDDPLHSPHGTAKNDPTTVAQVFQNSHEEISLLGEKVCMVVRDNRRVYVRPQDLSNEDVNSRRMASNISAKRGSLSSLDLSISPPVSRDIDCNIPLDCDSDENHIPRPSEVLHDSLGSTSEINKNTPTLQVQCAVSDKGKFIVESLPVKNNYIQLFPENRSNNMLQFANDPEKVTRLLPSSLHSSRIHNLPLQSEQMVNGPTYYSSLYDWPHVHPREPFRDFLPSTSNHPHSLSRHLMMLDNIFTRARGKFEFPTTWSEEELDCLWIGVRRHGVNNFDAILRDPRLHFSPWKMARDLADRWRDEHYRLFHGRPVSQVNYTSRPDFLSNHMTGVQLSLGVQQNPLHECEVRKRPPVVHYTDLARNRQFQKPVTNGYLSRCSASISKAGSVRGNLPHWLREAVEIPRRPSGLARKSGKCELHECRANSKQDDLIIINSDASSEETISDDHSIRP